MNKKDIDKYKQVKNKTLSSSDVVKSSFANVLDKLTKEEYILSYVLWIKEHNIP